MWLEKFIIHGALKNAVQEKEHMKTSLRESLVKVSINKSNKNNSSQK